VLGAIFTDKVVVQRLTDFIWVGTDTTLNERHCYRVARILYSLGRSIHKLNEYYVGLKPDSIGKSELHPRYFPSIRAYRDASGAIIDFAYVKPLERDATCVTFLAKTFEASPKSIVVKFVERYGVAAHKLLEKMGAAPQLLYYGIIGVSDDDPTYGHLRMAVMEYLDGMTANQAQKLDQLPPTFLDDVQRILNHLHTNDLVFGDVRSANIMITKNNKVKFVDFDWAGKAGVSRYPLLLSQQIQWPDGVGDGLAVMEKQHDLDMLTRLV
jgi:serine/threonine protein kinase